MAQYNESVAHPVCHQRIELLFGTRLPSYINGFSSRSILYSTISCTTELYVLSVVPGWAVERRVRFLLCPKYFKFSLARSTVLLFCRTAGSSDSSSSPVAPLRGVVVLTWVPRFFHRLAALLMVQSAGVRLVCRVYVSALGTERSADGYFSCFSRLARPKCNQTLRGTSGLPAHGSLEEPSFKTPLSFNRRRFEGLVNGPGTAWAHCTARRPHAIFCFASTCTRRFIYHAGRP